MVKYQLVALVAAVATATTAAFVAPPPTQTTPLLHKSVVALSSSRSSTSTTTSTNSSRAAKKRSVRDRSSQEAVSLIRDIVQAAFDAGPRAAPSRTLQAYIAISRTLSDFSPIQRPGRQAEEFSAPVALRKLFERLGATYIKLGQFVASSPSLFPKVIF